MEMAFGTPSPATAEIPLDPPVWNRTLFEMLLDARRRFGGKRPVIEDIQRKPLTYDRVTIGAMVLGRVFAARTAPGEHVGVMLPNVAAVAPVFFGLQAYARVPAMLNFTAGPRNLVAAIANGHIRLVVTARRFIAEAKLEDLIAEIEKAATVLYLEDVAKAVGTAGKLRGVADAWRARAIHRRFGAGPDDTALILFTSGSEGAPKGVALSHANLLSNIHQFVRLLSLKPEDSMFNPLPVFHSFGMTVGLVAPFMIGMRVFFYPSPLHYKQIPPLIEESGATILIGTDTFANGWGRMAEPRHFKKLQLVVLGAEKIKPATREMWRERFGIELLEGYGVTETAPVLAANTPQHNRIGTVGRLLPGMSYRLEEVAGLADAGRLWVRGPNVMLGYLHGDGRAEPLPGGWHDTGDIVSVDEDGYITIRGRAKRFAKLGGEMISLAAVEAIVAQTWPDNAHAVVAVPDDRKGEQLVLVTDLVAAEREALLAAARQKGVPELMVPRRIVTVAALPMLATGKTDYPAIEAIARA